ncbi:hypothetical protein ES288_D12G187400v1 [Gossypium darwinii]|uniref:Uncharacterized protein n=1 Tax=Gossypium darwinii TaxID=34276 RepID=A0A5D2ACB2_GOSDA|nr:hypothetical protein ES288_D12G187400v1 [Gossypium darwinii]
MVLRDFVSVQTPTVPTDKYRNSTTYQRPPLSTTTILPPLNQPCRLLLLIQFPRLKQQLLCLKLFMADMDGSSVDSKEESTGDSKLDFSEDEETLIIRMFNLVGERWSLIAGRIPGRTAEEIQKYWASRFSYNNPMPNPS